MLNCFKSFHKLSSVIKRFKSACCKCKSCNEVLSNGLGLIKCGRCGSFQPAPPTRAEPSCCPDYYKLLLPTELVPKFDIDLKKLKEEYLKLQGAVHPDRLKTSDSWSSWINRAHATLKDPLQRAIYLVSLHEKSQTIDSEDSVAEDDPVTHDISLVLEVREELDNTTDPEILSKLKRENDLRIRECCEELKSVLGAVYDGKRARECINRLRYWMSIDNQLKEKL